MPPVKLIKTTDGVITMRSMPNLEALTTRITTMPYWSDWSDWEDHLDTCPTCMASLGNSGDTADGLCFGGGLAWALASAGLAAQRAVASAN